MTGKPAKAKHKKAAARTNARCGFPQAVEREKEITRFMVSMIGLPSAIALPFAPRLLLPTAEKFPFGVRNGR
jgi:hypothetical protein